MLTTCFNAACYAKWIILRYHCDLARKFGGITSSTTPIRVIGIKKNCDLIAPMLSLLTDKPSGLIPISRLESGMKLLVFAGVPESKEFVV